MFIPARLTPMSLYRKGTREENRKLAPIFVLAAISITEFVWTITSGYRFSGLLSSLAGIFALAIISLTYGLSGRSRAISDMAYFGVLWIGFTITGTLATYIAATQRNPLLDASLNRLDESLNFDWLYLYKLVSSMPDLNTVLMVAYVSLFPQIILSVFYFCIVGTIKKNYELWWAAVVALSVTTLLSGLFPAAGTFEHFGVALDKAVHLRHFYELRDGKVLNFDIRDMQGIITFPSFHVVLAILLMNIFRGTRIFAFAILINLLMLISTPFYGGHYLIDMLAGCLIALFSIFIVSEKNRLTH